LEEGFGIGERFRKGFGAGHCNLDDTCVRICEEEWRNRDLRNKERLKERNRRRRYMH
jgi:hypothetical protein